MNWRWGGLAARIALTLVVGLAAAQATSLLLFYFLRPEPVPPISVQWLGEAARAALAGSATADSETWISIEAAQESPIADSPSPNLRRIRDHLARLLEGVASRVVLTGDDRPPLSVPMPLLRTDPGPPPPGPAPEQGGGARGARLPSERPGRQEAGWPGGPPQWERIDLLPRDFVLTLRKPGGDWLVIKPRMSWSRMRALLWPTISLLAAGMVVAAISVWWSRRLMAPLDRLTEAARRFGIERSAVAVPDDGPAEFRDIARAFNEMSASLTRFVADRTQLIAAISHDLRTPLTRLRLRAEDLDDPALSQKMLHDVAEMEAMIEATLVFARNETETEAYRLVDLGVLLESLCNDRVDAGEDATYKGPVHCALRCQPVAIRRAIDNLIGNACRHGNRACVSLADQPDGVVVSIADSGPGIPPERMEEAFAPFRRLEGSRNRSTGGVGLGLSVARTILRAHGGDVTLANAPGGGLVATARIPRT